MTLCFGKWVKFYGTSAFLRLLSLCNAVLCSLLSFRALDDIFLSKELGDGYTWVLEGTLASATLRVGFSITLRLTGFVWRYLSMYWCRDVGDGQYNQRSVRGFPDVEEGHFI